MVVATWMRLDYVRSVRHQLTASLEMIFDQSVARDGWEVLGRKIRIRCFAVEPSIKSSLTFLRKTPWARKEVEELHLRSR